MPVPIWARGPAFQIERRRRGNEWIKRQHGQDRTPKQTGTDRPRQGASTRYRVDGRVMAKIECSSYTLRLNFGHIFNRLLSRLRCRKDTPQVRQITLVACPCNQNTSTYQMLRARHKHLCIAARVLHQRHLNVWRVPLTCPRKFLQSE